tara:strand:+ start:501 stop:707 length:207 start_codon:yes stop_codon:yes gene_type:complete
MRKVFDPRNVCHEELRQHNEFVLLYPTDCDDTHDATEALMDQLLGDYTHTHQRQDDGDYHLIFERRTE